MSVKIRMTRVGRKKASYFRVVVSDSRIQRDGRFLEILGFYHPLAAKDENKVKVDEEKALQWLQRGARPSETVRSLFSRLGIMKKFHESRKKLFAKAPAPAPVQTPPQSPEQPSQQT